MTRAAGACPDPDVDDLFRDHFVPAVQVALRQRLGDDVDGRAALARLFGRLETCGRAQSLRDRDIIRPRN